MHARPHYWSIALLIVVAAAMLGCRGRRPMGGFVQVKAEPSGNLPEIEPPPQRLATATTPDKTADTAAESVVAKPAKDSAENKVVPASAAMPEESASPTYRVGDLTAEAAAPAPADAVASAEKNAKPVSSTRRTENLLSRRAGQRDAVVPAKTVSARTDAIAQKTDVAKTDQVTEDETLDAFSSSSPEIQQQALRQLLAMAARQAQQSAQPSSIDQLLKQAMAQPIDLPEPVRTPPEMQTTRLAATTASGSEDTQSVATTPAEESSGEPDEVSDAEGKIARINPVDDSNVQPVSASGKPGDVESVARAIDLGQETPLMSEDAVQSAVAQVGNALLSNEALFEMLIRRLRQPTEGESEAEKNRREIMTRHLMVMAGKPDEAVAAIDGLTMEEQEYLRHQLMGLWTIVDPNGHPVNSRRFSSALPKIREATKHLAASTDSLEVRSLAFCTAVDWFGQYKEFEKAEFKREQKVLLYCEVDNFAAKRLEGGFETHLQGSYTIYNTDNRKVVSQLLPADKQVSRNYLRDYFITYQMSIPTQLSTGDYRLELTMEDINGQKYGQASVKFKVVE